MKSLIRRAAICLAVLVVLCVSCLAASITDGCEKLPESQVQEIVERIEMHVTDREPRKTNFVCFAVRQDHYFAIGYDTGFQRNYDEIAVFDASGRFLYTIIFDDNGSFSLMWEGDTLLIHFSRGGYIFLLDQNGVCTAIYDSNDNYEIEERFRENSDLSLLYVRSHFNINGYEYRISANKIERTDSSGQTTVLYRANGYFKLIPVFYVLGFLVIWLLVFIKQMKNNVQPK